MLSKVIGEKCLNNVKLYHAVSNYASLPDLWGSNDWPEVKIVVRYWKTTFNKLSIFSDLPAVSVADEDGNSQVQSGSHKFLPLMTPSDLCNELSEEWSSLIPSLFLSAIECSLPHLSTFLGSRENRCDHFRPPPPTWWSWLRGPPGRRLMKRLG